MQHIHFFESLSSLYRTRIQSQAIVFLSAEKLRFRVLYKSDCRLPIPSMQLAENRKKFSFGLDVCHVYGLQYEADKDVRYS